MTAWTLILLVLEGRLISVRQPVAIAVEVMPRTPWAKPRVILDMRAVPSVDASGVGLIAAFCGTARDRGGDLRLLGLRERPRRLLAICGLLRFIQTFETEEEVLEHIVGSGAPELYLERTRVRLHEPRRNPVVLEPRAGGEVANKCSGRMTA
jgi:anti-sigma B factor antagonist